MVIASQYYPASTHFFDLRAMPNSIRVASYSHGSPQSPFLNSISQLQSMNIEVPYFDSVSIITTY